MKKISIRPTSFNQPFLNSSKAKVIRQNVLANSNDFETSIQNSYFPLEDNKILITPTTPQFPMPDINKVSTDEHLFCESEVYLIKNDLNEVWESWTPDTPSSDFKDPLMTNAVYLDSSIDLDFTVKETKSHQSTMQPNSQKQNEKQILIKKFLEKTKSGPNAFALTDKLTAARIQEPRKSFWDLPPDNCSIEFQSCHLYRKRAKPRLHLLQFIYCLLNSNRPAQCVAWVDKSECLFRIINPNKLTNLWGRYKHNSNMSFDSLSRSLRLYYASGRLERVSGQRNQYRFINKEKSIDFKRKTKDSKSVTLSMERCKKSLSNLNISQTTVSNNPFVKSII